MAKLYEALKYQFLKTDVLFLVTSYLIVTSKHFSLVLPYYYFETPILFSSPALPWFSLFSEEKGKTFGTDVPIAYEVKEDNSVLANFWFISFLKGKELNLLSFKCVACFPHVIARKLSHNDGLYRHPFLWISNIIAHKYLFVGVPNQYHYL